MLLLEGEVLDRLTWFYTKYTKTIICHVGL